MTRWFRFYDDAVNDPKVQRLPGEKFKAWVNLLCLASKNDGVVPDLADIAFSLRMSEDKVSALLDYFCTAGLIDRTAPMSYEPHNWGVRQYKSDTKDPTAAERNKRYRDRKRNDRNATVTLTDTRTETEQIRTDTLPSVALREVISPTPKRRAVALPTDWKPSLKAYELAEQFGQNVQIVESIFRDYLASSGKLYADHDAAFHNFIRNQNNFSRGGSTNGVRQSDNPRSGSIIGALDRALERSIAEDAAVATPEDIVFSLPGRSVF